MNIAEHNTDLVKQVAKLMADNASLRERLKAQSLALEEIEELADDRADYCSDGGPNFAMRILMLVRSVLK